MTPILRLAPSSRRRRAAVLLLCCPALALWPTVSSAQAPYPDRPITVVVGGVPGSSGDIAMRVVAKKLSEQFNQTVVIENRPGAQGLLAMQSVKRAKPDGYTLVVGSASSTVVAPAVRTSWPIDLLNDFAPVSLIANTTLMFVTEKNSPISSVVELVALARAKPGSVTYGNAAALYWLSTELLALRAGVKLTAIPYKGTPEASNDLLGGRLTFLPDSLGSATASLRAGRVKPLAVMSEKRSPLWPNVPTMLEQGYKDYVFGGTISLLAPAGTPPEILKLLSAAVAKAMESDEVKAAYGAAFLDLAACTPEELRAMQKRELAMFESIARDAKLEKQ